jgi:hypothetical protein
MDADRDGPFRWVLVILITAAIIGLVAVARGEPRHGGPQVASAAVIRQATG